MTMGQRTLFPTKRLSALFLCMNKPFVPTPPHLLVKYSELELALQMLATPDKQAYIKETIDTIRALSAEGSMKAVFTMVSAAAWLTDDSAGSDDGSLTFPR